MDADIAFAEPSIQRPLGVSTSVVSRTSRVGQGFVGFYYDWEVELDVFGGYRLDGWEETVTVWPVANRSSGNTTKADLVK
jgi:hypothetical protein